jgi:predicted type IV restriction endonuclease
MNTDKSTLAKLKKFGNVFKAAQERNEDESNTVMYLIKFFEEVLDYDPLSHEITKEIPIKERNCDFAIVLDTKPDAKPSFLVEAKRAGIKSLNEKHIEQASNYAANKGVEWVVLTNGVEWHLYHLTFENGIQPDLVFEMNFLDQLEKNPDFLWDTLSILAKSNVLENSLEDYYEQTKLLSPKAIVKVLLDVDVLNKVRQELNRKSRARLDFEDVARAVWEVLSKDAVAEAGDITPPVKKKKRRRRHNNGEDCEQPEAQTSATPSQTQPQATVEEEIPS